MPEVSLDKSRIEVENVLAEPDIHTSFSVVTSEVVNTVLLWPNVDHLTGSHSERISKGSCHES